MNESTRKSLDKLETWFGKKLDARQLEFYLARIKHIPAKAIDEIADRIIDNNQPIPSRFPTIAKIQEGWYLWKQENPQLLVQPPRTDCYECNGTGFLWAKKPEQELGAEYQYVFKCRRCENWVRDLGRSGAVLDTSDKLTLQARGYEIYGEDYT